MANISNKYAYNKLAHFFIQIEKNMKDFSECNIYTEKCAISGIKLISWFAFQMN